MTVGELIKKLQTYDASEEAIVAINTGDVDIPKQLSSVVSNADIPGRLDAVRHDANKRIVTLVHISTDANIDADATDLDDFITTMLGRD